MTKRPEKDDRKGAEKPTKAAGSPPKRRGRPKGTTRGRLPVAVHLRCSEAWRDYVKEFAEARGVDVSELLEEAVLYYAAHMRRPPPPRR